MEKTEITLEYTEQTPRFGKMLLPKKGTEKAVSVEDPAAGRRLLPDGAVLGQD